MKAGLQDSQLHYIMLQVLKLVKTNFLSLTVVKHFPTKQRELNKQFYLFYK